jgi:septum formation topological specificity factor MinE
MRSPDPTSIDVDERVNTLIAAERDFIIEVVGQALGEFRDELMAEIEKMIAEEVKKLRAQLSRNQSSGDGEVVLLPNPLRKWSGQA